METNSHLLNAIATSSASQGIAFEKETGREFVLDAALIVEFYEEFMRQNFLRRELFSTDGKRYILTLSQQVSQNGAPKKIAIALLKLSSEAIESKDQANEVESQPEPHCLTKLTARQLEIMNLILEGHSNKIIAAELGISQRTVENHRASIMRKTGARSLPDLFRIILFNQSSVRIVNTEEQPQAPSR